MRPDRPLVAKSHREIVDPTAYFLPRIDRFQTDGNLKAAIDEANLGLKAMPEEARLYAQRGLLRFELIRGKGSKLGEVAQKAIREDAEAAAKDEKLVAESAYILGLLEEELGNLVEAEKQYRQALKMHQGMADDAGRYRVALARLLLRDRPEVDAPAPKLNPDEKKKDDKAGARLERDLEPNVRLDDFLAGSRAGQRQGHGRPYRHRRRPRRLAVSQPHRKLRRARTYQRCHRPVQ